MTMNVKTHLLELNQQNQKQNGNGVHKWNRQKISHCKITQQKKQQISSVKIKKKTEFKGRLFEVKNRQSIFEETYNEFICIRLCKNELYCKWVSTWPMRGQVWLVC